MMFDFGFSLLVGNSMKSKKCLNIIKKYIQPSLTIFKAKLKALFTIFKAATESKGWRNYTFSLKAFLFKHKKNNKKYI